MNKIDNSSDADNNSTKKNVLAKTLKKQTQNKELTLSVKSRFLAYLQLSKAELYKVSWPTLQETKTTSYVVLGFVLVMAVLLGLVDLTLSSLIGFILS